MSASFPRSYIRWPHLPSCLILIAFDCMTSGSLTAQTTNPAYIHDFPSVDRVKAEIKGANPTDTLARQVAVFTYLPQIVQRMKSPRGYRSPLTPDEQRVIGAYDLAAYQLSQDFAKTHTPEEAKAFAQLHGRYEMDSKFYDDWYKRLVTPNVSRQYDAANATEAAHYKAHVDQQIRENDAIRAQQQQAQAQANRGFVRNDPGTVAVRRCIELGGNELSCVGKGLMTGLMGTDGMSDSDKAFFGMEDKAGLLLNGLFKSSGSKLALRFGSDVKTEIDSCGQLEPATFPYTLSKRPNALQVTVNIEPRPITLTMTREGNLIGPASSTSKARSSSDTTKSGCRSTSTASRPPAAIGLPSTTTPPKPSAAPSPHLPRSSPHLRLLPAQPPVSPVSSRASQASLATAASPRPQPSA